MKRSLILALACLSIAAPRAAAGDGVVAVLSSRMSAYTEALKGVEAALGMTLETTVMTEESPRVEPGVTMVIAIGGKAAMVAYPENVRLVHCLSPGAPVDAAAYVDPPVRVEIIPSPEKVVARLSQIAPHVKKLAVVWTSETVGDYIRPVEDPLAGVEIVARRLAEPDDLPDYLRKVKVTADALWLLPDPLLVNADSIATIRTFSWSNEIPFFAPTGALADQGAAVAVSSSFYEIGAAAGRAAASILAGKPAPAVVFPDQMDIVVNDASAHKAGLDLGQAHQPAERTTP